LNDVPSKPCPECGASGNKHRSSRSLLCRDCYNDKYQRTECPQCGGRMNIRAKLCGACRWRTDVAIREMSPEEVAWLAGILEGEGSFISTGYCSIQVTMTDRDISARIVEVTGVGRVHERRPQKSNHRPSQLWTVAQHEQIRQLLGAVLPWLGERRSEAALCLLKKVVERPGHTRSFPGPSRDTVLVAGRDSNPHRPLASVRPRGIGW
jgi:hypothetical protein